VYFERGLSRKPAKETYSSKQIPFMCNETNVGRLYNTLWKTTHRSRPQVDDMGGWLAPPIGRPASGPTCQPPFVTSVLYRLLGCISAVLSSRFDPRVQNWCSGLYSNPYPLLGGIPETLIQIPHSDQHTPRGLGLELSNAGRVGLMLKFWIGKALYLHFYILYDLLSIYHILIYMAILTLNIYLF
jgi:hypothetical protein